jgi:predicted DNA-binding transcriptional regulator AlpA
MPIRIERAEYFTAADVQRTLGVVRQTLWRWRRDRKVPQGRRYRGRTIVYTREEVKVIREYSNRLEPADSPQPRRPSAAPVKARKGNA